MRKEETVFWVVACPGHTDAWVTAKTWELATVAAAEFWGVPWGTVAAKCECKQKRKALKGVCPSCGRIFFGGAEMCDACLQARQDEERNLQQYLRNKYKHMKKRDKTAGEEIAE